MECQMRMLINTSPLYVKYIQETQPGLMHFLGWLQTPRVALSFARIACSRLPIACDNSAFSHFNASAFFRMLDRARGFDVEWVAVPDVVGDAKETLRLFRLYSPLIERPLAFVAQNGAEDLELPQNIRCLFVGGTTKWKLSRAALSVIDEAKRRGCTVHMGRVNSLKRIRYAYRIGCDSIDDSGVSRFPQKYLKPYLEFIESEYLQTSFC